MFGLLGVVFSIATGFKLDVDGKTGHFSVNLHGKEWFSGGGVQVTIGGKTYSNYGDGEPLLFSKNESWTGTDAVGLITKVSNVASYHYTFWCFCTIFFLIYPFPFSFC